MTYNIRNGGGSRLPEIVAVIRAHRPDLLALQELRGFTADGPRLRDLAAAVGMRSYLAGSRLGQPVAVLVREPAAVRAAAPLRRPFHHAAMRLTVGGLFGGGVDTRAVSRLARAGLVDLYRAAGSGRDHTVPTRYAGGEFGRLRLDYLLASPALAARVRRCVVVDAPPADTASDHYPVLADLDVELFP